MTCKRRLCIKGEMMPHTWRKCVFVRSDVLLNKRPLGSGRL